MFVELLKKVSDARVARGLHPIPQGCFRFHTLKHSVATIIANRATAAQVQHALSIAFLGF